MIRVTKGVFGSLGTCIATIFLALYALLPCLSLYLDIGLVTDWYRISSQHSGPLIIFGFFTIIFIWLYLYTIFSCYLRRVVLSGEVIDSRSVNATYGYFAVIALTLVGIFFLGLIVVNEKEQSNVIVLSSIVLLGIAVFFIKIVFPRISKVISSLAQNNKGHLPKIAQNTIAQGASIFTGANQSNSLVANIRKNFYLSYSEEIRKGREVPMLDEGDESIVLYTDFVGQLGFWLFILISALLIVMIYTAPVSQDHDRLLVAFFLNLLATIFVCFWIMVFLFPEVRNGAWTSFRVWISCKLSQILRNKSLVAGLLIPIVALIFAPRFFPLFPDESNKSSSHVPLPYQSRANCERDGTGVIVAAVGGGIAASVWTSSVLRKLQTDFPEISNCIVAISGVSGGSLGAYYFTVEQILRKKCRSALSEEGEDAALCDIHPTPTLGGKGSLNHALELMEADSRSLSGRTSLGSVAWGAIVGLFSPYYDRSDALMDRWTSIHCDHVEKVKGFDVCAELSETLNGDFNDFSQWIEADKSTYGKVNTLLVNTTIQDQGKRAVFSTDKTFSSMVKASELALLSSTTELTIYRPECIAKLKMVEAVKHSATFPYVSNATRLGALDGRCNYESQSLLIDGGYIDNEGVQTALDYINYLKRSKRNSNEPSFKNYIILKINAFPKIDDVDESDTQSKRRFGEQLLSPLIGLANIRKSHAVRNTLDVHRLPDAMKNITMLQISYPGARYEGKKPLPLSWHLTPNQKKEVYAFVDNLKKEELIELFERKKHDCSQYSGGLDVEFYCLWKASRSELRLD